jgi:hypothetical protein
MFPAKRGLVEECHEEGRGGGGAHKLGVEFGEPGLTGVVEYQERVDHGGQIRYKAMDVVVVVVLILVLLLACNRCNILI